MAKVLVVDDEKSIRLTLSTFLTQAGYDTRNAATATKAIALLSTDAVDVLIVDILLGPENGLDVARYASEHLPNSQTILMTGEPEVSSARDAIQLHVFDYLAKPVSKEQILEVVARAVEEKKLRDECVLLQKARHEYVRRLEQRVEERTALDRMVAGIATELVSLPPEEIDDGINRGLATVGKFVDADRSYVFRLSEDEDTVSNTHEWCAPEVEPQIEELQNIPLESELPWFSEKMKARQDFIVSSVADLPPEASLEKAHFEMQNIQSLVVVPMICHEVLIGFLGFDAVRTSRQWSEEIVLLLRNIAATFAASIMRSEAEKKLIQAREEWEEIFHAVGQPALILDPDHHIVNANRAAVEAVGASVEKIRGRLCCEVFHGRSECPENCPLGRMRRSRHTETIDVEMEALGRTFFVSCTPLLDDEGNLDRVIHIATDITERKCAEEALRESSARLQEAQRIAHIGSWEVDLVTQQATWSDELYRIMGMTPGTKLDLDELMGKLLHPEDRPMAERRMREAVATGELEPFEFRTLTGDGRERFLWSRGHVIRNNHGDPVKLVGINQDITERRLEEERRRTVNEGLRTVTLVSEELMRCPDIDTLYRRAVELARERLGVERCGIFMDAGDCIRGTYGTDTDGNTTDEHGYRDEKGAEWEAYHTRRAREDAWYRIEREHTNWNGRKPVPIGTGWVVITPIASSSGQAIGVFTNDAAITDAPLNETTQEILAVYCSHLGPIIERRRAADAVEESEKKYHNLVELAPDSIVVLNRWGRITECNEMTTKLNGYDRSEIVGRRFTRVGALRPQDIPKYIKIFIGMLRGRAWPAVLEVEAVRKDGSTFPAEAHVCPIRKDDQIVGLQVITRDLTQRMPANG